MNITVELTYQESFKPPRARKLRFRGAKAPVRVKLAEVAAQEAPVAMRSLHGLGGIVEYRWWKGKFWSPIPPGRFVSGHTAPVTVEDVVESIQHAFQGWYAGNDLKTRLSHLRGVARSYLIVDGVPWQRSGEPRYVLMTFGLGHNHGGTSLMLDSYYNPNIAASRYFNALQRAEALAATRRVAEARGDTNDLARIEDMAELEVLMPETIRCNLAKQHGKGDPFMNRLEGLIEGSGSVGEAGLKVMFTGMSVLTKRTREKGGR